MKAKITDKTVSINISGSLEAAALVVALACAAAMLEELAGRDHDDELRRLSWTRAARTARMLSGALSRAMRDYARKTKQKAKAKR